MAVPAQQPATGTEKPARKALRIGRFEVIEQIGAGTQGVVLLARDAELSRDVAIKLLRTDADLGDREHLIQEAQIIARVPHPNIVTLHQIGAHRGMPYLVFEFIKGRTLKSVIEEKGRLDPNTTVIWSSQILAGLAAAHDAGVAHGDLSPANILITDDGVPKVADFGLGALYRERSDNGGEIRGTLRYMAPELLRGGGASPQSDVFAAGAIMYEMLVGTPLFEGDNRAVVANEILNGAVRSPAESGIEIADPIAEAISCAQARDVETRYPSARPMKVAVDRYRIPRERDQSEIDDGRLTIEFLVRRMGYAKAFTALSGRISEVLKLTSATSQASARQLGNVLAKDPMLAQRVLGMANSAFFGTRSITNITGAIVRLGVPRVRSCVTRILVERQFEAGNASTVELMIQSFYAAALAKSLAPVCTPRRDEDAYLCSLFHDLGRTLIAHYMETEFDAVRECSEDDDMDELSASRKVIGVPYHEVGKHVAGMWQLPDLIQQAMQPLPRGVVAAPEDPDARVAMLAGFTNGVAEVVARLPAAQSTILLRDIVERVEEPLGVAPYRMRAVMDTAAEMTSKYAKLVDPKNRASVVAKRLEMAAAIAVDAFPEGVDEEGQAVADGEGSEAS